jgi:EAL domain-containing protein (putative c-di-GMP-specific phosphodiesterase class I)
MNELLSSCQKKYPLEDYEVVATAVEYYRHQGFQISIDDLGSGYSGLRVWSELVPDYVKIDQYFIREIHKSSIKREFARSIHEISKSLNCAVVAEGIETEEELSVVRSPSTIAVTKPPPVSVNIPRNSSSPIFRCWNIIK